MSIYRISSTSDTLLYTIVHKFSSVFIYERFKHLFYVGSKGSICSFFCFRFSSEYIVINTMKAVHINRFIFMLLFSVILSEHFGRLLALRNSNHIMLHKGFTCSFLSSEFRSLNMIYYVMHPNASNKHRRKNNTREYKRTDSNVFSHRQSTFSRT